MSTSILKKLWNKLSTDYLCLLNQQEYCDVTIKVGTKSNFRVFKAHSLILRSRSQYFKNALSTCWNKKDDDGFFQVDLCGMNISEGVFDKVLIYIYGGCLPLDEIRPCEKLRLMVTADMLMMDEFIDYLEHNIIQTEKNYITKETNKLLLVSTQIPRCKKLLNVCQQLMLRNPITFIQSVEFLSVSREYIRELLEFKILGLDEVSIFDCIIRWGIHNTCEFNCDLNSMDDIIDLIKICSIDQFEALRSTIKDLVPFIRFFKFDPGFFNEKFGPFKKLIDHELYNQIIQYHKNPNFLSLQKIYPFRLNSTLISELHISTISSWIELPEDQRDLFSSPPIIKKFQDDNINFDSLPFEFDLIFRSQGKRISDSLWREKVHNQGPTLTIIKTVNQGIFGGYKSASWKEKKITKGKHNKIKKIECVDGGDGFIFQWSNNNSFDCVKIVCLKLQWINKHLDFDMFLGGSKMSLDFRFGKGLSVFNRESRHDKFEKGLMYAIEEVEIFKVLKKIS
ncbi:serine-enriched protein [Gigaspora margarita]|uniref:Serine-enriched protein n=1 Tax=Gigaspora margarita TaxID=4874 RepID=A0A8H3X4G8_GIGMA|nr:serine-enriched protein [Gigaspora margarita]